MATSEDLDTELAAAIITDTNLSQRLISDYDDETGEQIPFGSYRSRQRIDYTTRTVLGSNDFEWVTVIEVDGLAMMGDPIAERNTYTANLRSDQRTLTDPVFWDGLAAVFKVNGQASPPQVSNTIERIGRVLKFTVTVELILAPS